MNLLAVSNRSTGAVNPQEQGWKFPLFHVTECLQHPLTGAAGNRTINHDPRHATA